MDIKRYSNLQKLFAVTAYVLRFTNIIRRIDSTNTKHLTTFELAWASLKLLRAVQYEAFLVEISNLKSQSHRLSLVAAAKVIFRWRSVSKMWWTHAQCAPVRTSKISVSFFYHPNTTSQALWYYRLTQHNTTVVSIPPLQQCVSATGYCQADNVSDHYSESVSFAGRPTRYLTLHLL